MEIQKSEQNSKHEERNSSIDIFRYICAIMVIAIHTHPFMEISEKCGYVFTQITPRIAVPFFCGCRIFLYSKVRKK